MASTVRRVQDLVVEDREVQGKTETDGVGGGKLGLRNIGGSLSHCYQILLAVRNASLEAVASYLVRFVCGSRSDLALLTRCELSKVSVVVTLPMHRKQISFDLVTCT
jgi:hypothetical protein